MDHLKNLAVALAAVIACSSTPVVMAQSNPANPEAIYGQGKRSFTLATGSPGELGLLQH
ncbi:hypothetical protein [Polynucleobacter necessarius]|uniref:hypothetical protein n=1 Tax=Polynucleobacter necessarius TaxID=576610 RepID=UPI0018D5804C|nr:hypothetical protein [Polynucleobacter necessarius]